MAVTKSGPRGTLARTRNIETANSSLFAMAKGFLSVDKLKGLLTKTSGSRGGERYRRAGITASSSFITKALNILISFLSVR